MKKIILMFVVFHIMNANAQITLVKTYPKVVLRAIMIEGEGLKYYSENIAGNKFNIYNKDHSIYKTLSFPDFNSSYGYRLKFISKTLFDNDSSDIDYFVSIDMFTDTTSMNVVKIYNENGKAFFSLGNTVFYADDQLVGTTIINAEDGARMILHTSDYMGGGDSSMVYNLPGKLPCINPCGGTETGLYENGNYGRMDMSIYPNPSNSTATLRYELPQDINTGEIILYNTEGVEIRRYKVDKTFNEILLDNSQLFTGTYFYQLTTSKGVVGTKKMVIIK